MSDLSVERRPRSRFDVRFASVGKQKLLVRGVAAFEINERASSSGGFAMVNSRRPRSPRALRRVSASPTRKRSAMSPSSSPSSKRLVSSNEFRRH